MKTMNINGEVFDVVKPRHAVTPLFYPCGFDSNDIYNHYERPSARKVNIFNYWRNWYYETQGVTCLFISSANTFQFSLAGNYCDPETGEFIGVLKITAAHNRIYIA